MRILVAPRGGSDWAMCYSEMAEVKCDCGEDLYHSGHGGHRGNSAKVFLSDLFRVLCVL
jgi:hypothetical protein